MIDVANDNFARTCNHPNRGIKYKHVVKCISRSGVSSNI